MSDNSTTRMLDAYIEQRNAPKLFLSSLFQTPERNFHNAEHVKIDVRRGEPVIAVPVPNIQAGARKHLASQYTNKKYTPAVYDLETTLSAWSSTKRQPGEDPFQNPEFRRNVLAESFRILGEQEDMIHRGIELQCSQIFQTGKLELNDKDGNLQYEIDFGVKPTHLITPTPWAADGTTGNPLKDIDDAGVVVRRDGKHNPTDLIFGTIAMQRFLANSKVTTRLDNLGLQTLANIAPSFASEAATLYGVITIGAYKYRLWMYDGYYIDPETGDPTPYVGDFSVIMVAEKARRDLTFGGIPMFVPPDGRAAQFLPSRMSSAKEGFDLTTNIWVTPDGKHLNMTSGTRALAIPTAVDGFACLTVGS